MNITATLPPQDIEAERAVLGSMMLVNDSFDVVLPECQSECFYVDSHRKIFAAFQTMYDSGSRAIDAVTMRDELTKRGQLDDIGGTNYLLTILETVPHAAHAEFYARIVREKWVCRRLIEESTVTLQAAYGSPTDIEQLAVEAEQRIAAISEGKSDGIIPMAEIIQAVELLIAEREDTDGKSGIGLSTGIHELDEQMGGFKKKNLVIVAARPAMGKTAFACDSAAKLVRANHPGAIFSLEMGKEELVERLLCAEARIPSHKLQTGQLEEFEHHAYSEAAARMRGWPLYIDDDGYQKLSRICAKLRRLKRTHQIEWAIIDYLQLVESDDERIPREQQVSKISRRFKQLSKELNIPLIVLSQLNRGVESREDKRPRLGDLRESGAIEQDADCVMFLHRPEAYDPEDRPGEVDAIVAKNRHGKIGTVRMAWKAAMMTYQDYSPVDGVDDDF